MLDKTTSSTGILLISLSSLLHESSTPTFDENNLNYCNLHALELKYNSPESIKSRVDSYVDFAYNTDDNLSNKYSNVDIGFMSLVQKFAIEQVELDQDFSQALNVLLISKFNSQPTKKRF